MSVRIGINPITWTNDDVPELGGDIPLERCLAETKAAGYAGTEMGGKFPRDAAQLGGLLHGYGLALVSGWYDGRILDYDVSLEFDCILPHLTLLRDLGCKVVVYADTSRGRHDGIFQPISIRPRLDEADWQAYGAKVTELARRMADFGVRMAFHHHMGTIVETDHEIDRLMASTGEEVGLFFDTGHCLFAGGNPGALLRRHIKRVVHFHCKDVRPEILKRAIETNMSFMGAVLEGIFTVPGDGSVAYVPLLEQLQDAGYAGWLVVEAEQDPRKAVPIVYAELGYKNLRQAALDARLKLSENMSEL
jgi:inosose dehydratase